MLALAVNYKAPRPWREKVASFASALERAFGPRLEAVVALPDPEDRLYDSNVLVVLSGPVTLEDHSRVVGVTPEGVSPLVTSADDRATLEAFLLYRREVRGWGAELASFASALERAFGPRLEAVVALPDPEDRLYDSNVLVVLSGPVTLEDHSRVVGVTPEGVSPLVTSADDRATLEAFLLAGGRELRRFRGARGRARADGGAG